ncbi:hypothetical protein [Flavobacterium agrisoli]|uniref:Uncharacterized protein n=1 Tax=Flavobacterium agrisoli TaxID=2793066 RepID=A0A934UJE7_9FLAO|nr:hypothetical protein [Flavobacterium agrisoli]MBK0369812.1 hypothetical protein [Flavobacterium agrisoli]
MRNLNLLAFLLQTALISYHVWTVIIAFSHGFWSGIITLFLPVLSEIYWIFKMFGENNLYAILGIISFPAAVFLSGLKGNN